jgi:methyl-accepting chemotaxis protein
MSIRTRLALAFALLLGLALAVAVVTLGRLDDLTAKSRELVDHQARRVLLAQEVNQRAQAAAIGLLKLLQTSRRDDRVPLYAAMDGDLAASDRAVRELGDGLLGAEEEQAAMARVADIRHRYGELFQTTVEMLEIEGAAPARDHFEARTGKLLNTLLFEIDALEAAIQKRMQAELEGLRAATDETRRIVLLLAGTALALGTLLAWVIGRSHRHPAARGGGSGRAPLPAVITAPRCLAAATTKFGDLLRSLGTACATASPAAKRASCAWPTKTA